MEKRYQKGITENRAIALFEKKYGTGGIAGRVRKLKEEFAELMEAIDEQNNDPKIGAPHVRDEISDLYCVLSHLASMYGMYHQELLEMGIDKVTTRETNPDYKRFK
jgi:hypothetical protein